MHIMDEYGKQIIDVSFVERFCIAQKPDAVLIVASYNAERQPVTVGRYKDMREAKAALAELFSAISEGWSRFEMPDSLLDHEEKAVKDARVKRKGGS